MENLADEKINEMLTSLVQSATNVAVSELPAFARELLAWEFYTAMISLVVCGILSILCWYGVIRLCKLADKYDSKSNEMAPIAVGAIICATLGIALTMGTVDAIFRATKVYVAPRVVLAEKTLNMFKDK